jgi:hypothetical protein
MALFRILVTRISALSVRPVKERRINDDTSSHLKPRRDVDGEPWWLGLRVHAARGVTFHHGEPVTAEDVVFSVVEANEAHWCQVPGEALGVQERGGGHARLAMLKRRGRPG